MADEPRKPTIRGRRIIERPRLTCALDLSTARIRMLVAGSGYGKTILLEQWAPRDGRVVGWFRARPSATDVAVVARGLARATSIVVPRAGTRMLERLGITQDPEREAVLLAEMLAEDLGSWPDDGLVVIDDYHHLAESEATERFVETLAGAAPVGLLLASRVRPVWVPPRDILSGAVLEVPQSVLAMSTDEAELVLDGSRVETLGLVALAGGWPAVVGLAAMVPDAGVDEQRSPAALYDLFAEEIYRGLDPTLRTGIATLAAMPLVDRELAATVLGADRARTTCDEALALGLMDERDGRLELHPLAEAFFGSRGRTDATRELRGAAVDALGLYRERRDWDPAFELVRRFEIDDELGDLMLDAIDDTLNAGRLPVLREWVRYARARRFRGPIVSLAEIELELRRGRHLTALTLARAALSDEQTTGALRYRIAMTAARAAHAGSRDEEALDLYRDALGFALTEAHERDARWGELVCTAALERPEAHSLLDGLEELCQHVGRTRPGAARRQANLVSAFDSASYGISRRAGPRQNLSIESTTRSYAALSAPCTDGRCARRVLRRGTRHGSRRSSRRDRTSVDPVCRTPWRPRPWRLPGSDGSTTRLRPLTSPTTSQDDSTTPPAYSTRMRSGCAFFSRPAKSPRRVRPSRRIAGTDIQPSIAGEALGSRALALATIARVDEASAPRRSRGRSDGGVEAAALYDAVQAVCAVKLRAS